MCRWFKRYPTAVKMFLTYFCSKNLELVNVNMTLMLIVSKLCSGRIPCPHPGRIWLEQRGLQRALYWHIEARVVLDLHECPDSVSNP